MALFESVTNEPTPWVFPEQRDTDDRKYDGVQSVLYLRPMTYKEWTTYAMRRADAEEKRGVAVEVRAERVTDIDREAVRSTLSRSKAIYKDDDDLTAPEDLAAFVERLDWTRIQQILFAVRSASALKEGAKNS